MHVADDDGIDRASLDPRGRRVLRHPPERPGENVRGAGVVSTSLSPMSTSHSFKEVLTAPDFTNALAAACHRLTTA